MSCTGDNLSTVPEGWTAVALGDGLAADVQPGFACGVNNRDEIGTPHLRPMNVSTEGLIAYKEVKYVPTDRVDGDRKWLKSGDVLFNNTNSAELVGKTALYDDDEGVAFSNHMTRVRCTPAVLPKYCALALHQKWREGYFLEHCNRHVSQASIGQKVLKATMIPLPPLAEQERIVAKVEVLLSRVRSVRQRLATVPDILKHFRQAVLAHACSGKLTGDWRDDAEPDWATTTLNQVGDVKGGITKNARRSSMPLQVPYLRVANVYADALDLSEVMEIGVSSAELERTRLNRGDLLFVEGNGSVDQIGRVAVWDGSIAECVHQNHLIRFVAGDGVMPRFVLYAMMSPIGRERLMEKAISTAGLHSLSISKIASVELDVPSVREQQEIIDRVEALFALAESIQQRVQAATKQAEALTQSILARAFRGELVPTEADLARAEGRDYEPAEQLLARIRAGSVAPRKTAKRRKAHGASK